MFMPNCNVISLSQLSPLVTLNFFLAGESVSVLQIGGFVSVSRLFLGVTAYAALFFWLASHCVSVSLSIITELTSLCHGWVPPFISIGCLPLVSVWWWAAGAWFHFWALESMLQWNFKWTNFFSLQFHSDISTGDYRSNVAIISFLRNLHSVLCGGYCQFTFRAEG